MSASTFWKQFSKGAPRWASQFRAGQRQRVFDEIDTLLESSGFPFCFDVTDDGSRCMLILSPEGDIEVAAEIDDLVAAAPPLGDWMIVARRQKKDLRDVRAIIQHLYSIDPLLECQYRIVNGPHPIVEIHIPDGSELSADEREGLGNTFLWHALGEGFVMDSGVEAIVDIGSAVSSPLLSAAEVVRKFEEDD